MSNPVTLQPVTVTVTWMDGTQEIYPGVNWEADGGQLWLKDAGSALCILLCNVKMWKVGAT